MPSLKGVEILASHLGYDASGPKSAVIAVATQGAVPSVRLVRANGVRMPLSAGPAEAVDGWGTGFYARVIFDTVQEAGTYVIEADLGTSHVESAPFTIGVERLLGSTASDVLSYFKAMRSSGEIDRKDSAARRFGESGGPVVDARGGWLDASGDTSKFLSHLSYTPTMSPQQIPLAVWAFLETRDRLASGHPRFAGILGARLRDEALFGADFLTRFRAPEGYFYTGIFDALTKRLDERIINAPLPESVRTDRYQASYRAGGGLAIAALARASREAEHGDATSSEYLAAAAGAFDDLERHNGDYLFGLDLDTRELTPSAESVVDDYCALLAATELFGATGDPRHAAAAEKRAASLAARYRTAGWFEAAVDGRPFFHAVEAGLPVLALLRFDEVVAGSPALSPWRELALRVVRDLMARTDAVANPFGYPRQRARWSTGEERDTFFFPHENDTGYWWQGENASIASLAAASAAVATLEECEPALRDRLTRFAADQVHWVLGRNPFDVCMLQGRGRNNVEYSVEFPNVPGGIVNGITSGADDEHDIGFLPPGVEHHDHSWRWAEQWIPHSAWFLIAVASL